MTCTFKTDTSKGFKACLIGLVLVVAPFLFGTLGAAINPEKEIKKVVQAVSARPTPSTVRAAYLL
jgi:hypothetical protein